MAAQGAREHARFDPWPFVVGLASLVIYLLLRQRTLHVEGAATLVMIDAGQPVGGSVRLLFAPLTHALTEFGRSAGVALTPYWAGVGVNATAMAIGVTLLHRAARGFGLDRREGLVAGAMVASCPAVVYFATAFNHLGLLLAFSGLATLLLVRLIQSPSWPRAILVGLGTAAAWFADGSAHYLPLWFALFLLMHVRAPRPTQPFETLILIAVMLGVHLIVTSLGGALLAARGIPVEDPSRLFSWIEWRGLGGRPWSELVSGSLVDEWLRPFLPLSLLALAGLFLRRTRPVAVVLHLALLPYLLACFAWTRAPGFGALLLPLAWPAAMVAGQMLRRWFGVVFVVVGLGLAMLHTQERNPVDLARARVEGLELAAAGRPVLLLVGVIEDLSLSYVELPRVERLFLPRYAVQPKEGVERSLPQVVARIREHIARGGCVLMPAPSQRELADPSRKHEGVRAFRAGLEAHFWLQPTKRGAFEGFELRAR